MPRDGDLFGAALAKAAMQEVEVWPENWQAFTLFTRLSSQWFVGMAGPTGLRYEALYPLLDRLTSSPQEWDELFEDVRAMEQAALGAMRD